MTEREKNMAEKKTTTKKTTRKTTAKKAPEVQEQFAVQESPQTFSQEDVQAMIQKALAEQQKVFQKQLEEAKTNVVQVSAETEKVVMRFQAEVADDNECIFGDNAKFGKITGKRGILTVNKSDFMSSFRDGNVKWMLDHRWLVVLSGLTDEEAELFGVKYRKGEVLDDKAFAKLLDMSDEELLEVFPNLCKSYKEMVARRFYTDWIHGGAHTRNRRELIVKLNAISKKDYEGLPDGDTRRKGAFAPIIEELNKQDI